MKILDIPPFYARDAYALRAGAPALLFVNVTWCGHCVAAKPTLEKVARALGSTVPVYSIDGDLRKRLVEELGVKSFPTILFADNNGIHAFEGERTFDNLVGFVCQYASSGTYCKK